MALEVSRRGMLGIIGAGIGAAIIRPGILMPIKPGLLIPSFGVYITAQMIATAFAQELYKFGSRRAVISSYKQTHVDLILASQDRNLPLEQFIERHIRPAACVLSASCKRIGGPLALPKGTYEAANGSSGGFSVRYFEAYDIHSDRMISRFDVLNS